MRRDAWAGLPACLLLLVAVSACTPTRRPAVVVTPTPAPTPAERLTSADSLVRAGCLDCLLAAYGEYDLLRAFPAAKEAATAGAVRASALIARRERELGLVDDGYGLGRARRHIVVIGSRPGDPGDALRVRGIEGECRIVASDANK